MKRILGVLTISLPLLACASTEEAASPQDVAQDAAQAGLPPLRADGFRDIDHDAPLLRAEVDACLAADAGGVTAKEDACLGDHPACCYPMALFREFELHEAQRDGDASAIEGARDRLRPLLEAGCAAGRAHVCEMSEGLASVQPREPVADPKPTKGALAFGASADPMAADRRACLAHLERVDTASDEACETGVSACCFAAAVTHEFQMKEAEKRGDMAEAGRHEAMLIAAFEAGCDAGAAHYCDALDALQSPGA